MRIATPTAILLWVLVPLAASPLAASPLAAAAEHAVAARTQSGNANANLHYVRSHGSTLVEEGNVSGSLPGHARAELHVGATFTGSFTFYTRYGEIFGRGSARPSKGHGGVESFSGTAYISGGTGRYSHARGHGGFYGTFARSNYAVVLQLRGSFSY
ncbi:MAG: autotransporter [Solirubrobacteraceae bacterium]